MSYMILGKSLHFTWVYDLQNGSHVTCSAYFIGFIFVCQKNDKKHSQLPCQLRIVSWGAGTPTEIYISDRGKKFRNKNLVYPNCLGESLKESGKREGCIFTMAAEGQSNWLNLFCEAWLRVWGCAFIFSLTLLAASWDGYLHIHSINKKKPHQEIKGTSWR